MAQYDNEYVRKVAARNEAEKDAVLCEPRLFAYNFEFTGTQQRIMAPDDVFRNGEKFPYRITHLVMAMQYAENEEQQTPATGDERMVQRYALRIRAHDTYYMNPLQVPLPLWANTPVTPPSVISLAQATWRLPKPMIMGNRDALEAEIALLVAPETGTERVALALDGVGLYSRQPKRFTGYKDISTTVFTTLNIADFRSDGTEPFEMQSLTWHHTPPTAQSNPIGNIRNVRARVRVNGNGTNAWWNWRDTSDPNNLIPANLFGITTGRAIVHTLPGDGWLWYPGEGITPEMESFDTTRTDTVLLACAGYAMVK